jgi:deoxycytidylate deaminase
MIAFRYLKIGWRFLPELSYDLIPGNELRSYNSISHCLEKGKIMRPDWDSYFMKIAYAVSERSTCDRALVGCVLVLEKRILTTGFNGSPAGQEHCDEAGHLMVDGHCVRTIHAETNAIIQAVDQPAMSPICLA